MESQKGIFTLNYVGDARAQLNKTKSMLSNVQSGFNSRMEGRTVTGIVISLIATLLWAGAYVYGITYTVKNLLSEKLFSADIEILIINVAAALILTLLLFVLADDVISWVYYGQIAKNRQKISRLQKRVDTAQDTLIKQVEVVSAAQKNGWNLPLTAGSSIPKEAADITSAASKVRSLKNGFINTVKNILFFAASVIVSGAFCIATADHAQELFLRFCKDEGMAEHVKIVCYVVMGIVCIGEILLAKVVWSGTDCAVKPLTLLILLVPPVAFVLLTATAYFVIIGVAAIVGLAISLGSLALGVMCLSAFCGG